MLIYWEKFQNKLGVSCVNQFSLIWQISYVVYN